MLVNPSQPAKFAFQIMNFTRSNYFILFYYMIKNTKNNLLSTQY